MKALILILLLIKFFILGIILIIGAVLLNLFAEILGFYTWYDLFINTEEVLNEAGIMDAVFIFIIYPIFLGFLAAFSNNLFKKIPSLK